MYEYEKKKGAKPLTISREHDLPFSTSKKQTDSDAYSRISPPVSTKLADRIGDSPTHHDVPPAVAAYLELEAAKSFGRIYHPKSMAERQEYGAVIDKDSSGNYSFANVRNSSDGAADPSKMTDAERNKVSGTLNQNSVAIIHTHWHPNGNLNFTDPDDYRAPAQIQSLYLVNRRGDIYFSKRSPNGIAYGFTHGRKVDSIK